MCLRALLLVGVGCALGAAANAVRPTGAIPWVYDWSRHIEFRAREAGLPTLTLTDMQEVVDTGEALVFDARPTEEYEQGHLPASISLPYHELDLVFPDVAMLLTPEQPVVTYCSGLECEDSLALATFLRDQGYTNVVLFAGGMTAWEASGAPVEGGTL